MKLSILKRYHDLATAGHQGVRRAKAKLKEHYYWPQMDQDIAKYVATCISCQRNADRNSNLPGLLQPLPTPTDRFRDISIDFATIPPHPEGWNQLMVRFITGWFSCGFGLPASIKSDRDTKFTSGLWTDIANVLGIDLQISASRHQQTNGQAEIALRTYERTDRVPTSQTRGVGNKPGVTRACT
jgi:hypothetical protein